MKTEKYSVGVEFKLLKIQLIICSVSKSLMTSQMCESKSKLQQSCRDFQNSNFYSGLSWEERCVCSQGDRRGSVDFFCSLVILKIQDLFGKFFLFLFMNYNVLVHLSLKIVTFKE